MTDYSIITADRLKRLRLDSGLSHRKLAYKLEQIYGIKISEDSLMNYEVFDVNNQKAYKNEGMRIQYLRCLAKFYGVSADYILGISDIPKPNTEKAREYYLKAAEKEKRLSNLAELLGNVSEEIKEVLNATP